MQKIFFSTKNEIYNTSLFPSPIERMRINWFVLSFTSYESELCITNFILSTEFNRPTKTMIPSSFIWKYYRRNVVIGWINLLKYSAIVKVLPRISVPVFRYVEGERTGYFFHQNEKFCYPENFVQAYCFHWMIVFLWDLLVMSLPHDKSERKYIHTFLFMIKTHIYGRESNTSTQTRFYLYRI